MINNKQLVFAYTLGALFIIVGCIVLYLMYSHPMNLKPVVQQTYDRQVAEILKDACVNRGGIKNFRLSETEVDVTCDYTSPGIRTVREVYLYGVEPVVEGHK